ncbi:3-oxoacyl-[acyl-carrier-protein] synthase, mitochondrial [Orchesella cincta]|uniref:3-oxoacyl-[acyl-carrier-protein] synthase n=1 Tax=Orchesella cincta TaxID=48709 RepID=A0A1D2MSG5_ORCCI|nr:3-oxoacyl-[acyl-carrier-protein] synthase, mitochondrial [Orchesella cincta]
MSTKRVVVTGMGLVTPLGIGSDFVWGRIFRGESGIRALTDPKYSKLPCRVAGTVPEEGPGSLRLEERFSEAQRRAASKGILFALVAAEEALQQSKLVAEKDGPVNISVDRERVGVAVGMGMLDLQDIQDTGSILDEKGYSRVSPYFIPRVLPNLAAGQISIKYGLQGPNHCASTACATGAHSIGDAFNFIRLNYADIMICGGTESSINPLSIAAFCRLRALSTKFNDQPKLSSRPFDTNRDGFVMGEGAGILVLEELNSALKRGAPIYGEILGYGMSGDGHHLTAAREDGRGALRAMEIALKDAGLTTEDISYVNCHATSTPIGDKAEITALKQLFKSETLNGVPISSTKGNHGHLLGAAGAVETIIALTAIKHGQLPPSIDIPEVEKDFQNIRMVTASKNVTVEDIPDNRIVTLKNSFGFGGTNASLCIVYYM